MKEYFEKLFIDYINTCDEEALEANDNNLSKKQIAHVRKRASDKIIDMVKKHGVDMTIGFLVERLNLKQK